MRVTIEVIVRCDTDKALTFQHALSTNYAIRESARNLATRLGLMIDGRYDVVGTISVDDGPKIYVNLGENHDDENDSRRLPEGGAR